MNLLLKNIIIIFFIFSVQVKAEEVSNQYQAKEVTFGANITDTQCTTTKPDEIFGGKVVANLIKAIKNNFISVGPLFCRDNSSRPGDTQEDIELKDFVKTLINKEQQKDAVSSSSNNRVLEIFRMVAFKKILVNSSKTNRIKLTFATSCLAVDVNKIPYFDEILDSGQIKAKAQDEIDFKKGEEFCKKTFLQNDFRSLAPYLTKDVLAESLDIISKVYPDQFRNIITTLCNNFSNTDEAIFKQEIYGDYVLSKSNPQKLSDFGDWLKTLVGKSESSLTELAAKEFQGKTDVAKLLSKDEKDAIKDYSMAGYYEVNGCLRQNNCTKENKRKINDIVSGLKKIRSGGSKDKDAQASMRLTYRGTRQLPEFIAKGLAKAAQSNKPLVLDKGFLSTSGNESTALSFANAAGISTLAEKNNKKYVFIIKNKSCAGIGQLSSFDSEDEFLCPPGLKFKVEALEGVKNAYKLTEVN